MGDIADMMLEGILDEETGEHVGDLNELVFGSAEPGFPVRWHDSQADGEFICPECEYEGNLNSLRIHMLQDHHLPKEDS